MASSQMPSSFSCSSRISFSSPTPEELLLDLTNRSLSVVPESLRPIPPLVNPPKIILSFSNDPDVFFSDLKIDRSSFDSKDIQCLQKAFQTIKLNQTISLFDLIGLRFYDLLQKLTDTWLKPAQETTKGKFGLFYLGTLSDLTRQSLDDSFPKKTVTPFFQAQLKNYIIFFEEFTQTLKKSIEGHNQILSIQTKANPSKKLQFLKKKTDPLLKEWDELKTFLNKCLSLDNPFEILNNYSLAKFAGSECVNPTSISETYQALGTLCLYLEMITTAKKACLKQDSSGFRENSLEVILEELLPILSSKNITSEAKKLLSPIHKGITLLHKVKNSLQTSIGLATGGELDHETWCRTNNIALKIKKTPEEFVEFLLHQFIQTDLNINWLVDCKRILEESIIGFLDPSFCISHAYKLRTLKTIEDLLKDAASSYIQNEDEVSLHQSKLDQELQQIQAACMDLFSESQVFQKLTILYGLIQKDYGLLFIQEPCTVELLSSLKKHAATSLNAIQNLNQESYKKKPLSNQLLWLSRVFVLCHDIEILCNPALERVETNIFPDAFLQFLSLEESSLEEGLSSSSSKLNIELPNLKETSKLPNPTASIQFSHTSEGFVNPGSSKQRNIAPNELVSKAAAKQDQQNLPETRIEKMALKSISKAKSNSSDPSKSSKKASGKKKAESIPTSRSVTNETISSQSSHPEAGPSLVSRRDLLESRKRRHVEKLLAELGLQPIRTKGSHTIWSDPKNARRQTVVPHHQEIDPGTLKAIYEQITLKRQVQS